MRVGIDTRTTLNRFYRIKISFDLFVRHKRTYLRVDQFTLLHATIKFILKSISPTQTIDSPAELEILLLSGILFYFFSVRPCTLVILPCYLLQRFHVGAFNQGPHHLGHRLPRLSSVTIEGQTVVTWLSHRDQVH